MLSAMKYATARVRTRHTGGINQAYLGLSGRYAGVALGFNISYNFGNITNDVYSMPESSGRTLFEHVAMKVRDWNIVVGAQYTARLSKDSRLTLGLTYSPKKTLLGTSQATVQELSMESGPDTVGFYEPQREILSAPQLRSRAELYL